jgi:hypothetical protein
VRDLVPLKQTNTFREKQVGDVVSSRRFSRLEFGCPNNLLTYTSADLLVANEDKTQFMIIGGQKNADHSLSDL